MDTLLLLLTIAVVVLLILDTKVLDVMDECLCFVLYWPLRLRWHALWIRKDKTHPSLAHDEAAMANRIWWARLRLGFCLRWQTICNGQKPADTKKERLKKLRDLETRLRAEYDFDVTHRQNIARNNSESPSQ